MNYTPEVLRTLQKIELEILKDFISMCEKYNIEYFAIGGTALGVIRHKGFIPWDDDIDIALDRSNFDKFIAAFDMEKQDKYYLLDYERNHHYPCMNMHMCLKGTTFMTADNTKFEGETGIFLDLFCLDNISDDDKAMKKQGTLAWMWGKIMTLTIVSEPTLYYYGMVRKVLQCLFKVAHYVLKVTPLTTRYCYKKATKYRNQYNNITTKRIAYLFEPNRFVSIFEKHDIYPTKKMAFEDIEIRCPKNIDKMLTNRYGDYMTLPPEEKRHNHLPYVLDFGPYGE